MADCFPAKAVHSRIYSEVSDNCVLSKGLSEFCQCKNYSHDRTLLHFVGPMGWRSLAGRLVFGSWFPQVEASYWSEALDRSSGFEELFSSTQMGE